MDQMTENKRPARPGIQARTAGLNADGPGLVPDAPFARRARGFDPLEVHQMERCQSDNWDRLITGALPVLPHGVKGLIPFLSATVILPHKPQKTQGFVSF